jgi:hypothetical protein
VASLGMTVRPLKLGIHLTHALPALACELSELVDVTREANPSRGFARHRPLFSQYRADVSFEHLSKLAQATRP